MRDQEIIRLCNRLIEMRAEEETIYQSTKDEDARDEKLRPLNAEWREIETRLYNLPNPTTPAGLLAVARAALAEAIKDTDGNICCTNLNDWLAYTVAEVVAEGAGLGTEAALMR